MSVAESKVTGIVKALSSLEDGIDSLNSGVSEIQKAIGSAAQSELAGLREKTARMASEEAELIIGTARSKAEAESERITREGESRLADIRSRIDASFDEAVDVVVSTVLKA